MIVGQLILAAWLFTNQAWSVEIARSTERQVQFVELFSSESCSSCPPADQWFSRLKSNPEIWRSFVPAVFHVDYWNHLSWKDDFSSREMTERQKAHANTWLLPNVYTPGVILSGEEWTAWRGVDSLPPNENKVVGVLAIEQVAGKVKVSFSPKGKITTPLNFNLALLGMGIKSKITSGENSGSHLTHDFLVLVWKHKPGEKAKEGSYSAEFDELSSARKTSARALIAWVEENRGPRSLQVVGGYLK